MAENRLPDNQKPGAATSEIQEGDQRMKDGDSVDDKIVSGLRRGKPMRSQYMCSNGSGWRLWKSAQRCGMSSGEPRF